MDGKNWMALMRVLTPLSFSATSMKKTMHFAWVTCLTKYNPEQVNL
jgi:hypothetical protein